MVAILTLTATPATPIATALQATPKVARMTKHVNCSREEKEKSRIALC